MVVEFEREGTIRIPNAYLAAGRLEHGYARTSYGVQGATHDVARYHPTDVSSFEEGYVALTRGRQSARIYIVDGNLADNDNELTHAPTESHPFGIGDIAQALGRRRSTHMAADASADLGGVARTLAGASLAQLAARRRQLDALMRQAPADMSEKIDEARRTVEAIRTRQQAWSDVKRVSDAVATNSPRVLDDERRVGRTPGRAITALSALRRAHTHASARLDNLEHQQALRNEWFETHSDLVDEQQVVSRAEHAREIQVRIAATNHPDRAVRTLLGPEPGSQRERLHWRRAVEMTATYNARYPQGRPAEGSAREQLLGLRPTSREAGRHYDQAAAAINVVTGARSAERAREADSGVSL